MKKLIVLMLAGLTLAGCTQTEKGAGIGAAGGAIIGGAVSNSWRGAAIGAAIGGVTGLLPVSGIPLPFVSFGGSSLVVTMLAAGILASVGRIAAAEPGTARSTAR